MLRCVLCATTMGIAPYKPNLESTSYSNTSRLYSRYGSEEMLSPAHSPMQA